MGMGCLSLLQRIFLKLGSNPGLLLQSQSLHSLSHQGSLYLTNVWFTKWCLWNSHDAKSIMSPSLHPSPPQREALMVNPSQRTGKAWQQPPLNRRGSHSSSWSTSHRGSLWVEGHPRPQAQAELWRMQWLLCRELQGWILALRSEAQGGPDLARPSWEGKREEDLELISKGIHTPREACCIFKVSVFSRFIHFVPCFSLSAFIVK